MSDILWVAIMRSEIRSPTTKALSPILLSHLPRRYPHRHEACITNHPIGNERMNRIVGEEIRLWVLLTPIDEPLCSLLVRRWSCPHAAVTTLRWRRLDDG